MDKKELARDGKSEKKGREQNVASHFDVLTPYRFLEDFQHEAYDAQKRVWVQAMYVEPGSATSQLVRTLKQAAGRSVDTRLHVDWFGLLTTEGEVDAIYSLPFTGAKERLRRQKRDEKKRVFMQLQENAIRVSFTNPPTLFERLLPYRGRNHMKMAIADDTSYIGGVNFSDRDFTHADFMVKIKNKKITDIIAEQFKAVEQNTLLDDVKIPIDKETTLFIDSGKPGRSIILTQAIELIQQAHKSIYHTNQLIPDGVLLKALYETQKRGVYIQTIVPEINSFSRLFSTIYRMNQLTIQIKKLNIPLLYYPGMLHAKLTIIDEKVVLFGSHNLSEKGVNMGTAEIALESKNKKLISNLQDFYEFLGGVATSKIER